MKNLNPLEKYIERKVCTHARELGILVYKFQSPGNASVPDRLFVAPGNVVFWIEFKRKGEKPTKAQAIEIEKIRKQGGQVFVVDDVASGKSIVCQMCIF